MVKKSATWQKVLLVIFAAMLVFGNIKIGMVGNHLQYIIAAPAPAEEPSDAVSSSLPDIEPDEMPPAQPFNPNSAIASMLESLKSSSEEWDTLMDAWTMSGVIQETGVDSDIGESTAARVTFVGENGLIVNPLLIRYGRQFSQDELQGGSKLAILDEKLALAIFKIAEPIDRKVTINGEEYTVIGVARHSKDVGDYTDYGAYVPLMSAVPTGMQLDVLQVEAVPKKGVGAASSFRTVVSAWQSGGTVIDLGKEGMAAGLWLRMLIFVLGMTVVLRLLRFLNHNVQVYFKRYKAKLQIKYAVRLMPELIGAILLFALGYGAAAGLAVVVMNYIIQPVFTFTEWIPAVLVEWSDITSAFWKVWQAPAVIREFRSPEIMQLRFLNLVIQAGSAGAAILLALMYARHRERRQDIAQGMLAMVRQGAVVSRVRVTNPLAFEEYGYVADEGAIPAEGENPWPAEGAEERKGKKRSRAERMRRTYPMVRILNAEKLLLSLPVSRKPGTFVIEITDGIIEKNNLRLLVESDGKNQKITETSRDWDLQMTISALTALVYGKQSFHDFLESQTGFDMRMRSPAMDGLFAKGKVNH